MVSILAVLRLVAISFATAVTSNTTTTVKKKESPLFGIRTKLAIGQKLQDLTTRFIRQRVFFIPFPQLMKIFSSNRLDTVYSYDCGGCTYASEQGGCWTCPIAQCAKEETTYPICCNTIKN